MRSRGAGKDETWKNSKGAGMMGEGMVRQQEEGSWSLHSQTDKRPASLSGLHAKQVTTLVS